LIGETRRKPGVRRRSGDDFGFEVSGEYDSLAL
jgi:hypothetical protein